MKAFAAAVIERVFANWRSSLEGLAAAGLGFVLFYPEYFPAVAVALAKYAALGGLAGIGLARHDNKL